MQVLTLREALAEKWNDKNAIHEEAAIDLLCSQRDRKFDVQLGATTTAISKSIAARGSEHCYLWALVISTQLSLYPLSD
uniref:Uncharacterized protein n=1 Tax=Parascaris univalens TaxID=6257 RepID=A0A915AAN3_PARUN